METYLLRKFSSETVWLQIDLSGKKDYIMYPSPDTYLKKWLHYTIQ